MKSKDVTIIKCYIDNAVNILSLKIILTHKGQVMASSRTESRSDSKIVLRTELANTLLTIPTPLQHIISDYIYLSFCMRGQAKKYKQEPAKLGKELLNAFNDPAANVACALDDLTETEKTNLLISPEFPSILKFYYYSAAEFKETINSPSNEELKGALCYGFLNTDIDVETIKKDKQFNVISMIFANIKRLELPIFLKYKSKYEQLYTDNPSLLIQNLIIRYASLDNDKENCVGFLMAKISARHLHLPNLQMRSYFHHPSNMDLSNTKLTGAELPLFANNLNLQGADLRHATIQGEIVGYNFRNAILTGINKRRSNRSLSIFYKINEVDFLNATLDEKDKNLLCASIIFSSTKIQFSALVNWYNINRTRSYSCFGLFCAPRPPSWDLFVHAHRITRATNKAEFDAYRSEIPANVIIDYKGFNTVLEQVANEFLKLEQSFVVVNAPRIN